MFEPETTVGRVKELVWNTWPNGVSRSRSLFFCLVDYSAVSLLSILSPIHEIADAVFASPHQSLLASAFLASVLGERADLSQFY